VRVCPGQSSVYRWDRLPSEGTGCSLLHRHQTPGRKANRSSEADPALHVDGTCKEAHGMPGYTRTGDRIKGREALDALEASGKLVCSPADVARVIDKDHKTVYSALERGEIPHTRIGQRYHISIAWLRRQVDGTEPAQAERAAIAS